ncbi:MAG: S8 family serine peptidase [Chloroflexi bacterium]|nr:S8 family serine peptidase [Chloroflexota bacterium]
MIQKRLTRSLAISFCFLLLTTFGASGKTDFASLAKATLAQRLAVPAPTLTLAGRAATVRYPTLGLVIHEYKFVDARGSTHAIALDEQGNQVNVDELDTAELAAYQNKFGKMDRELLRALAGKTPDELIEVNIWLTLTEPDAAPAKPEIIPPAQAGTSDMTRAERDAIQRQFASAPNASSFDAAAWEAKETANLMDESARVETVTRPIVEEMRRAGFEASASAIAPLVNVRLPVRMIRLYARRAEVEMIHLAAHPADEMNVARKAIGAHIVQSRGITGAGSKIAVLEYNGMPKASNPFLQGITRDNFVACPISAHATGIAGIIRSRDTTIKGIAPDTRLWMGCGITNADMQTMTNRGLDWGAETISLSWYSGSNHAPGALDKFYDRVMFVFHDLVIKSAGNRGAGDGWVTPPGLGYNTLSVGNYDDKNTVSALDDLMQADSSWKDPTSARGDREKPEVVAPGTNIKSTTISSPWTGDIGTGTSYAAPMVTGITALMYQRNPALKAWPESTKAILMATANQNKEGDTRLSDVDGAGGVWAPGADTVARNNTIFGGWGGINYTCATPTNLDIATIYLYHGFKARIVIVWDQNTSYPSYALKPSADLDMQIYSPSNTLIASSYGWDNTFEIIEFTPTSSGNYRIHVDFTRCNLSPRYLGWAWSQP